MKTFRDFYEYIQLVDGAEINHPGELDKISHLIGNTKYRLIIYGMKRDRDQCDLVKVYENNTGSISIINIVKFHFNQSSVQCFTSSNVLEDGVKSSFEDFIFGIDNEFTIIPSDFTCRREIIDILSDDFFNRSESRGDNG